MGGSVAGVMDNFSSDFFEGSGEDSSPSIDHRSGVSVAHGAVVGSLRAPHFDGANR